MTKLLLVLLLLGTANELMSMGTIKLPSQIKIASRLGNLGTEHFVEKTKIDTTLGDEEKTPFQVYIAVEHAVYKYNRHQQPSIVLLNKRPEMITAILKDHPEAIASLKKDGIL